jgi:hypothetical protein
MQEADITDNRAGYLRMTLFLVANGAIPATSTQELYELAWANRIKPVNERGLKAGCGRKGRRRALRYN